MSGRILALLGNSFHASGGIAQFNRDLIVAWAELDAVTEIILLPRFASASGSEFESDLPDKVVEKSPASSLPLYVLKATLESIGRPPFDIIFCGHLNMAPLAVILSKLTGTPVWLQLHGIEAWSRPSRTVRWSAERVVLVTCVSRHTRRMFLRWANVPSHNALILPNTVAEQFNWQRKRNPRPAEHVWAGNKVMLTVSRLSTREGYKGHDKVIRCMPALSREYDSLIYAIAGVGDQQDTLQSLADSLDVGHRVRFLGRIGHEELPSLYRDADVFVMPSTGEGFGIVFLESIACGTPAIAGNCDGARDPLHDGALGVLSEDGGLTECIREALGAGDSSAGNRHCLASRAESAVRHFGRSAFSANTLAVTHRALGFASEGTNVGQVDH